MKISKKIFIIFIILTILVSCSFISCNKKTLPKGIWDDTYKATTKGIETPTTTKANTTIATKNETVEYKLATLYAGNWIEKDDITVYEFKELLDKLEKKTVNSRIDISDITVTAQRILKEHGISRTLLQILNDLNESIPEGTSGFELEEIAAAYLVLMTE